MGAKSRTAARRRSFYEVVFAGSPKVVRGFMAGLRLGSGRDGVVIFNFDAGIHHEGVGEKLAEFVRLRSLDCHVVVDSGLATLLRRNAQRIVDEAGLEIRACRHVRSAELPFEFTVYARHYHREIMDLLADVPRGVRLRDFEHEQQEHPEAKGPEAYSPVHDFTARGRGKLVGRVDLLVGFRSRLSQQALIKEGEILLHLA
jgi:hypothetical protein